MFEVPDVQPYTTALTNEMSEIEAAFQKFGLNTQVDEDLFPTAYLDGDYNEVDISFDSSVKDSGNGSRSEGIFGIFNCYLLKNNTVKLILIVSSLLYNL